MIADAPERGGATAGSPACRRVSDGSVTLEAPPGPGGLPPHPRRDDPMDYEHNEEAVMAETWSGEFYCVKCKAKREATGEVKVNEKGTRMAKAVCPECGTNLNRILGKA